MNNYKILFAIFLVFGLIGMIRDDGPVAAGNTLMMHVNIINDGEKDLDDLSVRLFFYDLGTILQTNPFDLNDGDNDGKILLWDVPRYVSPGNYWVRITASNDDVREVEHRVVTVI